MKTRVQRGTCLPGVLVFVGIYKNQLVFYKWAPRTSPKSLLIFKQPTWEASGQFKHQHCMLCCTIPII